jgi:hypothetical protein
MPVLSAERPTRLANVTLSLLVATSCLSNVESFLPRFLQAGGVSVHPNDDRSHYHVLDDALFTQRSIRRIPRFSVIVCQSKSSSSDGPEDDEDEVMLQDEDWRAFRAKLVISEQKSKKDESSPSASTAAPSLGSDTRSSFIPKTRSSNNVIIDEGDLDGIGSLFQDDFSEERSEVTTGNSDDSIAGMTPLDPSQWAYDSGDVIEQGAVILGGVEQEFGFGLRQQYFHKAAILVLDHTDTFTKGIILNRPTDLTLEDDLNPKVQWRVWFGGDVEGLHASHPDIVCLHSLKSEKATRASIPVMKDIQWTTFENAKVGIPCVLR